MTYPDNSVLVACDLSPDGAIPEAVAELCGAASTIGTPVVLAISSAEISQESQDLLAQAGAAYIVIADSAQASLEFAIDALEQATAEFSPVATLCLADSFGSDLAGRASVRLKQALLTDVTGVDRDEEGIIAYHSVLGDSYRVTSAATFGSPIITLRPGVVEVRAKASAGETVSLNVNARTKNATITEIIQTESSATRPALTSAKTVVSGGRAFSSKEEFGAVEKLADALGAAIGASRAAVDAGCVDRSAQVGQAGTSIQPNLYFALGISGALQHLTGMQASKHIIAVNKDEQAPIFEVADFGVVGDVFEVVPQLTALLEQRKG